MCIILELIFLASIISTARCRYIDGDISIRNLPNEIVTDIRSILTNGVVALFGDCPPVRYSDVTFYLYNRQTTENPLIATTDNFTSIDAKKPIIFLVHGWISSAFTKGLQTLIDAYLKRYDMNIIVIDWSRLAKQFYFKAFCNLPAIADKISDFICEMSEKLNIKLNTVRMIGHSMGAQISGLIGRRVQMQCNQKLKRITGLDPAGPLYNLLPASERLDETDAEFVDVLHTNSGQFGYVTACGTVDFYVNCGTFQPQCAMKSFKLIFKSLMNMVLSFVTCHHTISWYYMAESINDHTDKFQAFSCTLCQAVVCLPKIFFPKYTIMGEHTPMNMTAAKPGKYISIIMETPLYTDSQML